jgi:hypothetical protein
VRCREMTRWAISGLMHRSKKTDQQNSPIAPVKVRSCN